MAGNVVKTPNYVNAAGIVRMDFLSPDFDALVDNKGYDVIWERALPCPCAKRQGSVQSTCQNCGGTGWVFINPKQIKAVIQSINKDTQYKEWSQERLGTASFTVRSDYHLGFMDKMTVMGSSSIDSENRVVFSYNNKLLISTIYPIKEVLEIFVYQSASTPFALVDEDKYVIEGHYIRFLAGSGVVAGSSVTISYKHELQYHILDLNHDVRNTIVLDNSAREQPLLLPISAVGRRVDVVIGQVDYTGTNILDNSYEEGGPRERFFDTTDGDAIASELLEGRIAYNKYGRIVGTLHIETYYLKDKNGNYLCDKNGNRLLYKH